MPSQRRAENYFKTARLSRGYHVHVLLGGLAFVTVLLIFTSRTLGEINQLIATLPDHQLSTALSERVTTVAIVSFVSSFVFIILTSIYVLMLGQRVGGPIIAICRYIREIRSGTYDFSRQLRKNDELTPIMTELRELARELAARSRQN